MIRSTLRRLLTFSPAADLAFGWTGLVKYAPLVLCAGFFAFSAVWLAVGPLDWHIDNSPLLSLFLGASLVALVGGYVWGIRRVRKERASTLERSGISANTLVIVGALVSFALFFPTSFATTGRWFPDVLLGLTDPGRAYDLTKVLNDENPATIHYLRFLLAPITVLVAPLTYFLWPRLSWVARLLGALTVLSGLALNVAQGINKGMAEFTAYLCLLFALIAVSSLRKGQRKRLVMAIVAAGLVLALFAGYYALNMRGRLANDLGEVAQSQATDGPQAPDQPPETGEPASGPVVIDPIDPTEEDVEAAASFGVATPRPGHFIYGLPGPLRDASLTLSGYVTHGYRGLSMALDEPWTPTYGLGFSGFLRHNVAKVLGGDRFEDAVVADTYAGKIAEAGWPVGLYWATFFVHPASDISFPGVVVLMLLIGFGFATAWRDTVTRGDPLAAGVFFYLCMLVFYLPANNQLFQGGELAVGFTVVLLAWLVTRNDLLGRLIGRRRRGSDAGLAAAEGARDF